MAKCGHGFQEALPIAVWVICFCPVVSSENGDSALSLVETAGLMSSISFGSNKLSRNYRLRSIPQQPAAGTIVDKLEEHILRRLSPYRSRGTPACRNFTGDNKFVSHGSALNSTSTGRHPWPHNLLTKRRARRSLKLQNFVRCEFTPQTRGNPCRMTLIPHAPPQISTSKPIPMAGASSFPATIPKMAFAPAMSAATPRHRSHKRLDRSRRELTAPGE